MEKYITNPEGLRDKVAKYGVAIIPGVLNNDECEHMKNYYTIAYADPYEN
jgi:hypothetical protein